MNVLVGRVVASHPDPLINLQMQAEGMLMRALNAHLLWQEIGSQLKLEDLGSDERLVLGFSRTHLLKVYSIFVNSGI